MDCAYFVGPNGPQDHWELRLSLRSIDKHFAPHLGAVWIVGHVPPWINRAAVACLEFPDPYTSNKDANLINKLLRLSFEPHLSDPFLMFSDDHFLLRDCTPEDFQPWHDGPINGGRNTWGKRITATRQALSAAGFPTLRFDCHVPYPIWKAGTRELLRFPFGQGNGQVVFTTYFNANRIPGPHLHSSRVRADLRGGIKEDAWRRKLSLGNAFGLIDDRALGNRPLRDELRRRFPNRSPYEITGDL